MQELTVSLLVIILILLILINTKFDHKKQIAAATKPIIITPIITSPTLVPAPAPTPITTV